MKVLTTIPELRNWRRDIARANNVAFVPTMGNLHQGHLTLVRDAQKNAEHTIVSIFVNPLQFGPAEDFEQYPRTIGEDLFKLKALDVSAVFMPNSNELYPEGRPNTIIKAAPLANTLCGLSRPGFFDGIVTVVHKLFQLIRPDIAVFGEKDYQQCLVIEQMVRDFNLDLDLIFSPIIREKDGLAMSSRNRYLSDSERRIASNIFEGLLLLKEENNKALKKGDEIDLLLTRNLSKRLTEKGFEVDYISIRNPHTLLLPQKGTGGEKRALVAAKLGRTRLIDNIAI
jgi:pantoate--beta-alanine ligase